MKNDILCVSKGLYEFFYRKVYSKSDYSFYESETSKKHLESFIKLIDNKYSIHCVGKDFLIKYFSLQIYYWIDLDLEAYNKKINLSFIIGKKAFERFLSRDPSFDDYSISNLYKSLETSRSEIESSINKCYKKEVSKTLDYEEREKLRYYNSYRGLLNCISNTTLYNSKSTNCLSCKFNSDCKEILKKNNIKLYRKRNAASIR